MVRLCCLCEKERAVIRRPKTFEQVCRECFYEAFEQEIHETVTQTSMFKRGERVAVAASGGKDSTVLAHILTTLNAKHDYGLDLFLLSVDEGIRGYRDDSLETVKRNEAYYKIPLKVVSYEELYGWTMDQIVAQVGTRNNCTFCGVFRRQALDRGAQLMKADKVATGHNADDMAETVLLNMLRGDVARLGRCTSAITGEDGDLPRVKPFKYTYEKEIVMYAYFKKLDYFSTECVYAPFAARGFARDFVKDLEAARPSAIIDLIHSAEQFRFHAQSEQRLLQPRTCERCGFISSQPICKACTLLEGLNKGLSKIKIQSSLEERRGSQKASAQCTAQCLNITPVHDSASLEASRALSQSSHDEQRVTGGHSACCRSSGTSASCTTHTFGDNNEEGQQPLCCKQEQCQDRQITSANVQCMMNSDGFVRNGAETHSKLASHVNAEFESLSTS
ncbi:hypothetical protein CEUSTIGMA_g6543.t1 [Chlamydomonas eustigma]|uniref:Cytoplasmic tRNA 2-thiolation protein 1 n=1 Tax=Chlamydomonas eustigma TaxID=1157962 RepID=A0A250X7P8_9CHLO|nr:hypothetical protein CEUSTIGMA_g6543.t1 [Chlamydomonas eustigma]|eukprot:GAX79103.1 hypothetical protein CEUSTIGMA_g6543.t1 [Chlamydomonas eustigma]